MSIASLILGQSGTGKTTSLMNINPAECLLIQSVSKPLPFRSKDWTLWNKDTASGNIFHTDNAGKICEIIVKSKKKIIIIDDFQYVMANEFMRRSGERGFDKFTEIAKGAWDVMNAASNAGDDKRVYILSHTETSETGQTKIKTIGKLLDEKITIEGLVTIVLRTARINSEFVFLTQNNGSDTVKSPIGMFASEHVPNDLAAIDTAIVDYYNLTK
jgi:predicted ATP-dependent serine protease